MPRSTAEIVIYVLWIVWLLYWIACARNVKATKWHESITSRAVHESLFVVCAILLALPGQLPEFIVRRIVPPSPMLELAGTIALAIGLSVTAWGRQCLGENWSGTVSVKEGHTLIRTGPYGLVRHPIYSGLLFGLGGTALTIGEWRGVFAVASALFAFLWKIRVEETQMLKVFPAASAVASVVLPTPPFCDTRQMVVGTATFTDPGDYQASVAGASINLVLTGGGNFDGRLTWINLRRLRLFPSS
jgi:protein-S-isoprenylcysteine O-methyltransferase Ste14